MRQFDSSLLIRMCRSEEHGRLELAEADSESLVPLRSVGSLEGSSRKNDPLWKKTQGDLIREP